MLIVVLGMHRSGTSALTGLLEACGFSPGEVPDTSRGNAKGNREYQPVRRLNNELLKQAGGSWREPVTVAEAPDVLVEPMREALDSLQATHSKIIIKDPRMLFTWEAWRPLLPAQRQLVGSFRHPLAVAQSLIKRNRFELTSALALWSQYNQKLVDLHRSESFPLVRFDLAGADYLAQFSALAKSLLLTPDMDKVHRFYDAKLVHESPQGEVPPEQADLYAYLTAH